MSSVHHPRWCSSDWCTVGQSGGEHRGVPTKIGHVAAVSIVGTGEATFVELVTIGALVVVEGDTALLRFSPGKARGLGGALRAAGVIGSHR